MRDRRARMVCAAAAALAATLVVLPGGGGQEAGGEPKARAGSGGDERSVLVFSRTTGFRHVSIPFAIAAIRELGEEAGFAVSATEDPGKLRRKNLRRYDAVIFLLTTGTVLEPKQRRALKRYIRRDGGGYAGIHSAADTEYGWPFYGRLVGAWFHSHPIQQTATLHNEARRHPATAHLPKSFSVFEEFYSFQSNPRPNVRVLLTIDESSYGPDPNTTHLPGGPAETGVMGDHPMSWCHDLGKGRSFYTALGHENYLYEVDWFREHLLGGILTAMKHVRARCTAHRR